MDLLATFRDQNIFPSKTIETNVQYELRKTGKAIVLDDENKIILIGNKVNDFWLLPGGGIENKEDPEIGTIREIEEETGCSIKIQQEIGRTMDYRARDKKQCLNYCYLAKLLNTTATKLTDQEADVGLKTKWFTPQEVKKVFENQYQMLKNNQVQFYNTGFNIVRDRLFLNKFLGLVKHS